MLTCCGSLSAFSSPFRQDQLLTCRIIYAPIGTAPMPIASANPCGRKDNDMCSFYAQEAQRSIINGGKPSVFFRLQLYQICGINWMHQSTVPIVPSTLEATVTLPSPAIDCGIGRSVGALGDAYSQDTELVLAGLSKMASFESNPETKGCRGVRN